ncbi:negative regulator of genetic competence MecA [Lachnospiraceae bacterium KM106-2]|nr:negative regulator of genetic competence MecA [Lachnospiraceae bacterium KM106-2]
MKIEKISDNQIRCTLNKEDLSDRQLRLSELAYGTEKAKMLFRDMMQQAAYEFGFEADDIPLMIEAIPVSNDCLILVVTKVEDPDELDTRFSKFSPHENSDTDEDDTSYADEILNCFSQLDDLLENDDEDEIKNNPSSNNTDFIPLPESLNLTKKDSADTKSKDKTSQNEKQITKIFCFDSLDDIIDLSKIIIADYKGNNILYKDSANKKFYLILNKDDTTTENFNKICNIISEYGKVQRSTYAVSSYFSEHYDCMISTYAVQNLAKI